MQSITYTDWLIVVLYLGLVTFIGVRAMGKVKTASSFFISDRRFGKVMMIFSTFGVGTQADQAVSVASKTYQVGASGIWYQWMYLFVTPFYWLLGPMVRRMRSVTCADLYEKRYDRSVSVLYVCVAVLQLVVTMGLMMKGSAVLVEACTGGAISEGWAIVAMVTLTSIYSVAGGLSAAILTDFIQGLLTIVLSFILLPYALHSVGGMSGLRAAVANPDMFSIVAPSEITIFYIIIVSFNGLVGWITQPTIMVAGASRTELDARIGQCFGSIIKRLCTIAWTLVGLCAVAIYAGRFTTSAEADQIYGLMARDLLPQAGAGLLGLFIASMLASVMSSVDANMVLASGLFVENLYKPFLRKKTRSERHYILIGRIAAVVVMLLSLLFTVSVSSVVAGLEIFWKVAAMMGVAAWLGLFWRRATVAGAWAGTLAGVFVWVFTETVSIAGYQFWDFNATLASHLPHFMLHEGALSLPWQMIIYLAASTVVQVLVSFVTPRVDETKLDRFYECLRTPLRPDEPETEAFRLPPGSAPAPRRVLIGHADFEIPVPSRVSIYGFLGISAVVVLLILLAVWIFSLGQ
ncbi:MAG: sodium:solute symporter family protein [Phycisphaeraceae bacterium]|nr:sodium:solute symporter family protein [Phycisphaeraceae bacterium]